MTTSTTAAPAARGARSSRSLRIAGRQTFWRAVRAEWLKLTTLRSTWISSLITLLITSGIGAAMVIIGSDPEKMGDQSWHYMMVGTTFGQIVVAVMGALIVTGEYSSGQIRSTLAAIPRRSRSFWAKALTIAVWSFLLGAVSILAAWAISAPLVQGEPVSLGRTEFLGYVWGSGLAYAGIALMSLGLGFLLRSTAGAITVVTVLLFVINIPLSLAGGVWSWARKAMEYTLSQVSTAVVDPYSTQVAWAGTEGSSLSLTHAQGVLVFIAWCVIPLLAGWLAFSKRDA
ncbi:MAG: ABC transporter permease subunit [Actinomyces urogenitalis]|mgnify:FL=1|uniref:ABC transporter permease n=2 Tax=Actinomyces urogenitalis TaxID=103621 RepID=A0A2I1KQZ0_9ACTO|nr:ABC transporter permease subunit [Actinomyces urogenitalis]MBS5977957.1 ABC transporter permease subunit [Actinomyces urogenitalis]MDU0972941.1 ABC transporter permease subunit [Actinomyces urogenitalis]PKY98044.1 ABC transporter permease [Actinomyces urogenitalis]